MLNVLLNFMFVMKPRDTDYILIKLVQERNDSSVRRVQKGVTCVLATKLKVCRGAAVALRCDRVSCSGRSIPCSLSP